MDKIIRKKDTGEVILARGHWCASFWCHFRGLMLRSALEEDEGLIFVHKRPSISNTAIHMLFMRFSIAVIWLDPQLRVVDAKYAKPWRLVYAPAKAAQYYIEAHPILLERVQIGDVLTFD
jgi:uncharacterized membrane protein (UPF0127 family)